MKNQALVISIVAAIICLPGRLLEAREEVDRDLLSQSRSQESVGRSVQSTVADLESLLADLESNGLIEENMIEKMRDAKQALNSIGEENIPAATEKLRSAALSAVGRGERLLQANREVDGILKELKKTARDVGDEQKRSAYGQMISQMLSQNQDLQEQTRKWGEEQLTDPSRSDETRDGVRESQSEMEAQFDALKDMLEREIAQQEDSPLKDELQDLLDALEGKEFNADVSQDFAESNLAETPNQPFPETGDFAQAPQVAPPQVDVPKEPRRWGQPPPQSASPQSQSPSNEKPSAQAPTQPEGGNPPEKPGENGKPEARSSAGENQEKKDGPPSTPGRKDPAKDEQVASKPGEPEQKGTAEKTDPSAKASPKPGSLEDLSSGSKTPKKDDPLAAARPQGEDSPKVPADENEGTEPKKNKADSKGELPSEKKDPKVDPTNPEDKTTPRDSVPRQRDPKSGDIDSRDRKQAKPESVVAEKEKEGMSKDASDSKKTDSSAQNALEESGKAISANDAGAALASQKKFEEILSEAIGAMSSAMADSLQPNDFSDGPSQMGSASTASLPMAGDLPDPFAGMAFGAESTGSAIGEADLEALLSGEDPDAGSQNGSGEGSQTPGEQTAPGEEQANGDQSSLASANPSAGVPSPSPNSGKQQGAKQKAQGKPSASSPGAPGPGKGGASKNSSMPSSNPFAPPMMTQGGGAPGEGSGTATASFDKPHGTHFETTAIKGGGGPAKGNYLKTQQSRRNLAEVARQKIQQDYQRRLPAEYRVMTAEYFELLGSLEE